jgi:hypothetical protein
MGFLRAIKIHSMTCVGGEVKPSVSCHRILWHIEEPYKYEKRYFIAKFTAISHQVSPALLLRVSVGNCQRALVDESGMVRIQMGTHSRLEMVTVHGTPCVIPCYNSNSMCILVLKEVLAKEFKLIISAVD